MPATNGGETGRVSYKSATPHGQQSYPAQGTMQTSSHLSLVDNCALWPRKHTSQPVITVTILFSTLYVSGSRLGASLIIPNPCLKCRDLYYTNKETEAQRLNNLLKKNSW